MRRRLIVLFVVAVLSFGVAVPSAFGWCNGGDNGNGYGTHDWILDEAIRLAGPDAGWIDTHMAMISTDDPDSEPVRYTHSFRDQGLYGGAPQAVTDLYYDAVTAYAAGDRTRASWCLGLLSHYYSDICNPFHSSYDAATPIAVALHLPYEYAVDGYTRRPGQNRAWIQTASPQDVVDIRAKTVEAARFSRARFSRLFAPLLVSPDIDVTQPEVQAVTSEVLSRAANDLADVIRGIARGAGTSAPPAVMKVTTSRGYPAPGSRLCVYAKCTDAGGRPVEGAAVTFLWPTKSGVLSAIAYTGPSGVAHNWQTVDALPLFDKAQISAVSASSGEIIRARGWFVPSVALASGSSGLRASVSPVTPRRGSTVRASVTARDKAGRAVAGLPVTFTWKFKTKTYTMSGVTDGSGVARASRNIGQCTRGFRVTVTAKALSAGVARSAVTSFVPR